MLILCNLLNHYLNSHQLWAKAALGSKVQMAAVAKSFPEQEEISIIADCAIHFTHTRFLTQRNANSQSAPSSPVQVLDPSPLSQALLADPHPPSQPDGSVSDRPSTEASTEQGAPRHPNLPSP